YSKNNPKINRDAVQMYNKKRPMIPWKSKCISGFKYSSTIDYCNDKVVSIGQPTECKWCHAKKWKEESPGICCSNGKVVLSPIEALPEPLHSLLLNNHPESQHFLTNIRKYNGCFQMTSFGAKTVNVGGFMSTFKIQGQVYHRIGSVLPSYTNEPSFLQIYFVGNDEKEAELRSNLFPAVKPRLVGQLQKMLHNHNQYDFEKRDIILQSRDTKLVRINETHRAYDALQYPLMFCRGQDGYSIKLPQSDPSSKMSLKKTISASELYFYRIMERQGQNNYMLLYRSFLNQFLVDMHAEIETERLNFIRHNQSKLRAENYVHLKDAMCKGDGQVSEIGKIVVLLSSFTGRPRYMHERTQDAMTYVRHYGRPDLFITFTLDCQPPDKPNSLILSQYRTDWEKFGHTLSERTDLKLCLKSASDIDDAVNLLTNNIQSAVWESAIQPPPRKADFNLPIHIRNLISLKRRAQAIWQHSRYSSDKRYYNALTLKLKRLLASHRSETYANYASSLSHNDGSLWKASRIHLRIHNLPPTLRNDDGTWAVSDQDKSNIFMKHLENNFQPHYNILSPSKIQEVESFFNFPLQMCPPPRAFFPGEVHFNIKKLLRKKSPGFDLITAEVIRNLPKKTILFLTQIYNAMLRLSYFPLLWKYSIIILILKPEKPPDSPTSYRPISLLPLLSKLFEKLLLKRIIHGNNST
ncbi:Helitron helicase-like domain, partial [Cinara cedri]